MTSIESIIERQFLRWEQQQKQPAEKDKKHRAVPRIVTVSRQAGSRGSYFAFRLAEKLGYQWIHREIIDAICQSSGYRKRIIESLDERYRSHIEMVVDSLLTGQAVDHSDYYRHLCYVVLSMSQLGGVVLVGRGGGFILGPKQGFHIRFVCPKEKRIENLVKYKQVSRDEAIAEIEHSDAHRHEYIQKLFDADIDDPLQYDLVINSAYLDVEELLPGVVQAISSKMEKLKRQAAS